jgi:hypothetical protein
MSEIFIEKYNINFSSSDRDNLSDKSPLNFTVWLNDDKSKSTIYRSFKNIKKINFNHIVFPSYVQLIKLQVTDTDPLYDNIITVLTDVDVSNNDQLTFDSDTYEICNAYIDGLSYVNFTINKNINESFEFINDGGTITVYKYIPITIDSPGNRIQYLSIHPCDNTQIYSTHNKNIFRYLFPKLKTGTDLYTFTRQSSITYPNNNLLQIKKLMVQLMNNRGEPMIINNLDHNYGSHSNVELNDESDYSHPKYYLRHPLNPMYQLDIFMSIECFEKRLQLQSVFNNK